MKTRSLITVALALSFTLGVSLDNLQASIIPESYDLHIFTDNGIYNDDPAIDLYVLVSPVGDDQVRFEFHNDSLVASSIEGVYIDNGLWLSDIASIDEGPGTAFSLLASPPDLPAGNLLNPPFETSEGLLADSDPPPSHNGVNPGEWMALVFDLVDGVSYDDLNTAIQNNSVRIGVHLIALPDNSSESAVSTPEPVTLLLLVTSGLVVVSGKALLSR